MAAMHDIEPRILAWLNSLANLTRAGTESISPEKLATYANMLAKDGFPSAAFTSDSLHEVAQEQRFFPAYDDVRKVLFAWWNAHKPRIAPALADAGAVSLDAADRAWVAFWHKRRGEIFAGSAAPLRGSASADIANLASLVKSKSPRAWASVSGEPLPVQREPTQEAMDAVAALLHPELHGDGEALEGEILPPERRKWA